MKHTRFATPTLALATVVFFAIANACSPDDSQATNNANQLATQGADIYATSCASCHGADLTGTDKGPSHLSIVYEPGHHGDETFRSAIANGAPQHHWNFGNMPPVPGLSNEDVDAVIAFVRTEQQRQGFER